MANTTATEALQRVARSATLQSSGFSEAGDVGGDLTDGVEISVPTAELPGAHVGGLQGGRAGGDALHSDDLHSGRTSEILGGLTGNVFARDGDDAIGCGEGVVEDVAVACRHVLVHDDFPHRVHLHPDAVRFHGGQRAGVSCQIDDIGPVGDDDAIGHGGLGDDGSAENFGHQDRLVHDDGLLLPSGPHEPFVASSFDVDSLAEGHHQSGDTDFGKHSLSLIFILFKFEDRLVGLRLKQACQLEFANK